ncbi:hypothetical protein I6A84_41550, partial [Frankia sp. CNm7]|uniref:hypothetical protein n=1 Tax=Frankia nepalensis TaxID=1836974 RepID=UPI001933FEF9
PRGGAPAPGRAPPGGGGPPPPRRAARTGPALRRLAGLGEAPAGARARAQLVDWLRTALAALPEDLREVAAVALALDPRADQRILTDRLGLLAVDLDRDPRTLRRRVTDAFRLLAETLAVADVRDRAGPPRAAETAGPAASASVGAGVPTIGWYIERAWAVMRLDRPEPELVDTRRIVAVEDGLSEIVLSMSLPRPTEGPPSPRDLLMEVVFGARTSRVERRGDSLFSLALRLPRPLRAGERHALACVWRMPPGHPMVPRYAMSPTIRCDALDVRVRFPDGVAARVQLVNGLPVRAVEDLGVDLPTVPLDGVGEAYARFSNLALGLSYGLRWT